MDRLWQSLLTCVPDACVYLKDMKGLLPVVVVLQASPGPARRSNKASIPGRPHYFLTAFHDAALLTDRTRVYALAQA